jgi:dihydroorotase-like cyclic amidohydrolase
MNGKQSYLIRAGALLDPLKLELQGPCDVAIEDGLIKEVSDRPLSFEAARAIAAPDLTLIPGLIDLHAHFTPRNLMSSVRLGCRIR